MQFFRILINAIFVAALCLSASGQTPPAKDVPANEIRGVPPRAAPGDYQAHAAAGTVTIAAEFLGHSVPRLQGSPLITEDHIVVELGVFGPPEARLKIATGDFSLRVNERKAPYPSQPFGMVFHALKDPDWEPPEPVEKSSKTAIKTGGQGGANSDPPAPVHMPLALQRIINQYVQKVALPEGDRPLPEAGLIFFPYHGKVESIHSLELTYTGPAGAATLILQP